MKTNKTIICACVLGLWAAALERNKEQAIATAKKNVTGYIEERSKAMEESRSSLPALMV